MNEFMATEIAYKNGYNQALKDFAERIDETVWYHINAKGELKMGANSENLPLYKAEDILKIAKELERR